LCPSSREVLSSLSVERGDGSVLSGLLLYFWGIGQRLVLRFVLFLYHRRSKVPDRRDEVHLEHLQEPLELARHGRSGSVIRRRKVDALAGFELAIVAEDIAEVVTQRLLDGLSGALRPVRSEAVHQTSERGGGGGSLSGG
jgi:hypothetical protein